MPDLNEQMRDYARAAIASRPAPVAAMTVEQARRTGYGEGVRRAAQLVEQAIDNEGRMALAARIRDLQSATPASPSAAQAAGVEHIKELEDALRFYANGEHFMMHQPDVWDTVSGEPANFYEDESCTATVEDGSVAKAALAGKPLDATTQAEQTK